MQLFVAIAMYHLIHNSVQMLSGLEDLLIVLAALVTAAIGLHQVATFSWKKHVKRASDFYEIITEFKHEVMMNWDCAKNDEVEAHNLLQAIGCANLRHLSDQNKQSDISPSAQEVVRLFISRLDIIQRKVLNGTQTVAAFNRHSRKKLGKAMGNAMIHAEAARRISLMKFVKIRIQSIAGTAY
jgi:hypothetical protein